MNPFDLFTILANDHLILRKCNSCSNKMLRFEQRPHLKMTCCLFREKEERVITCTYFACDLKKTKHAQRCDTDRLHSCVARKMTL